MAMNAVTSFKGFAQFALAFLYAEVCQICGVERATAAEGFVCPLCWRQVVFIHPPFCKGCGLPHEGGITAAFECANCRELELHFSSARSAVAAGGMVLVAIHRYNYQRALWIENFLADLLIREAAPVLGREKWDWIVPVPLHPTKQREREFNQAERLARRLSSATQILLNTRGLKRVEPTRTQTLLPASSAPRTCELPSACASAGGFSAESGLFCWMMFSPRARRRVRVPGCRATPGG
jgi:competence protein ComFC